MEEDVDSCTGTGMTKKQRVNTKEPVVHPKGRVMVMEAVAELNWKGGVSLRAVKKYIRKIYKVDVDVEKRADSIRMAVRKTLAQANGELVQMKGSGLNGTFKSPLAANDVVKPSHSNPMLSVEKNERAEFQYECGLCDSAFSFSKRKELRNHLKFIHGEKGNKNRTKPLVAKGKEVASFFLQPEPVPVGKFEPEECVVMDYLANSVLEEDGPIPDLRLMIIGALDFLLMDPTIDDGVSYEFINRNVQEAFNVRTDCLDELNVMVQEGILSDDGRYSKNTLRLHWSGQNIQVRPGDLRKVRKGKSERSRTRRRSAPDEDVTEPKRQRMDVNVTGSEDSPRQELSEEERRFARSVVGREGTPAFHQFSGFLTTGEGKKCLEVLRREGVKLTNMSSILHQAGAKASEAFKELYNLWFDERGKKTHYLNTLEREGIKLSNMSSILGTARANAAKAFKDLYDLWFNKKGQKTQYLKSLEKEEINLSSMSGILNGAGSNAAKAFRDLYDLWFDVQGKKTEYLNTLNQNGVSLVRMSSILNGAGAKAPKAFKDLYDLWFNRKGKKTRYLKTLKREGISLCTMSSILSGAGAKAAETFKELYDLWFDEEGNKTEVLKMLEERKVSLANVSSIISGAGSNAPKAFKDLHHLWFDKHGKKTRHLITLEKEGISLNSISSILHGSKSKAAIAFQDLCNLWFDEEGNKKRQLKHFIKERDGEKGFTIHNLSGMLSGSGANIKDAFQKLHNACFDEKGKRTQLLGDFCNAGFKPRNLSSMLCGSGPRASSILKRLHSLCFHDEGERTELLNNFSNARFRPVDLCDMLSGTVNSLQEFHDFCFVGQTKEYLNHFLNEEESISVRNLCNILHGAKANICSAFKDLHDVCFDEAGNKTQLLDDFWKADFTMSDLSSILTMAGNNAASILKNVHKCCFNGDNCLNHFLAERELFTPKNLSKVLHRVGLRISSAFEKFHGFCFDKAGNKTDYLNDLIRNNSSNTVINKLYKNVGKVKKNF